MKRMMVAAAIVALTGTMAFAQGAGGGGGAAGGASVGAGGGVGNAPVGHRQPRRSTFENEAAPKTNNGIGQVDPADAELDRKIKSICRGC